MLCSWLDLTYRKKILAAADYTNGNTAGKQQQQRGRCGCAPWLYAKGFTAALVGHHRHLSVAKLTQESLVFK
jgi:hypothetical protein